MKCTTPFGGLTTDRKDIYSEMSQSTDTNCRTFVLPSMMFILLPNPDLDLIGNVAERLGLVRASGDGKLDICCITVQPSLEPESLELRAVDVALACDNGAAAAILAVELLLEPVADVVVVDEGADDDLVEVEAATAGDAAVGASQRRVGVLRHGGGGHGRGDRGECLEEGEHDDCRGRGS